MSVLLLFLVEIVVVVAVVVAVAVRSGVEVEIGFLLLTVSSLIHFRGSGCVHIVITFTNENQEKPPIKAGLLDKVSNKHIRSRE